MPCVTLWKSKQLKQRAWEIESSTSVEGRTIKQDCVKQHLLNHHVHMNAKTPSLR